MLFPLILAVAAVQSPDTLATIDGVRTPAYARDGRIAFAALGDLWVVEAGADGSQRRAVRITSGPAWDRDPAWTPAGDAIVFASDRSGTVDLWRLRVDARGVSGVAERLTQGPEPETEPSVAPDGTIVFVRGRGAMADLYLLAPGGGERRFTEGLGEESGPAFSPDGRRVAYTAERDGARRLHIRELAGRDVTVLPDRAAERPAWAPDGQRLAFTAPGRAGGLWVTADDGSYTERVAGDAGSAAWSPDGGWLAVAELDGPDAGYNGDPDRLGDRAAGDAFAQTGRLRMIGAPVPPRDGVELRIASEGDRRRHNAEAYDRVWDRVARLYFGRTGPLTGADSASASPGNPGLTRWIEVGRRHRPDALAARTDADLADAIYAMTSDRPPAHEPVTGRAAVSSAHPLATAAGLEILRAGGNVVDAAVAVSFALGVVEPDASGPGGYGEMLIHLQGMAEPEAIEFMTRVPEAATLDNPALQDVPRDGPRVANVPGVIAGMGLAWRKHGSGRVTWAQLVAPAIRIAEQGFAIDEAFATTLRRERESFEKYESSRKLFFRDGRPLAAGDTLRNPDLAWTLRQIAEGGAQAFYEGEPARRLVDDLHGQGNAMTIRDMNRYFAAERKPVTGTYRGHTIYSGPPPVTGGAGLVAKLNLLEQVPRGDSPKSDPAVIHAMIEAWKLQPSTANRIADPDLWPVDVTPFESKDTARMRWRCFDPRQASRPNAGRAGRGGSPPASAGETDSCGREAASQNRPAPAPDPDEPCDPEARGRCRSTGTTAFAVADADGNMVAVTQTLGTWGGNFYVSPGLGFLYNDKFHSYRTDPDGYGARLPYARNSTVIAPTLVFRGTGAQRRPLLAAGAAGNAWITSAVYEIVVGVIDYGLGPQAALELPRFLPGGRGPGGETTIQIESGFAPAAIRRLEAMGHSFQSISLMGELRMGYGAAVLVGDGKVEAGADPRRSGAAGAVR